MRKTPKTIKVITTMILTDSQLSETKERFEDGVLTKKSTKIRPGRKNPNQRK